MAAVDPNDIREQADAFAAKTRSALLHLVTGLPPGTVGPKQKTLIGVSGGRDSVALLHFLVSEGWDGLIVVHLDHGLRGEESDGDAAFVKDLANRYGLPCECVSHDVTAYAAEKKLSIEVAARVLRETLFAACAVKHQASSVFLAHHAEDDAETILGNLCRGSGLRGVSGIALASQSEAGFWKLRPMLKSRRSAIEAYVQLHGVAFREDSTNALPLYRRNRIRAEAIPLLSDICGRDVVPLLTRFGALSNRDGDCLDELTCDFLEDENPELPDGSLKVTQSLRDLHPAILSRVLIHWLTVTLRIPGLSNRDIEDTQTMLDPGGPAKINLPGNRWLRRKAGRLFVQSSP